MSLEIPDRFDRLVLFERRPDIAVGQQAYDNSKIDGIALEHPNTVSCEMTDHGRYYRQLDFLFPDKAKVFRGPFGEFGGDVDLGKGFVNALCHRIAEIVKKTSHGSGSHGELSNLGTSRRSLK